MFNLTRGRTVFLILLTVGILLRLASTLVAFNQVRTQLQIGGDSEPYVILATTVAQGRGLTYAGQPTAFRPPLYPLFLAGMMKLFGQRFVLATRVLQFVIGLLTVWLCGITAAHLFDEQAGRAALPLALYVPTLAAFPTVLMVENQT